MTQLLTAAALAVLLLSGCGDGTDETPTETAQTEATATEPAEQDTAAEDAAGGTVEAGSVTVKVASTPHGDALVDNEGRAVYVFDNDAEGKSNCTGQCLTNWPPLLVDGAATAGEGADAELMGTITRDDGSMQATYAGRPLYRFAGDVGPGDVNGHGVGGVWWLVGPDGEALPAGDDAA